MPTVENQTENIAEMAGKLAHDFNNQLMVIAGYADDLCTRLKGNDRESAVEIKQAAAIARLIAAQLMMLSRRHRAA